MKKIRAEFIISDQCNDQLRAKIELRNVLLHIINLIEHFTNNCCLTSGRQHTILDVNSYPVPLSSYVQPTRSRLLKIFHICSQIRGETGGGVAKQVASSTAHVPLHVSPIFLSRKDLRLDLVDILLKIYAKNSVYLFTSCLYLLVRVFIKVMNVLKASLEGNSVRL